MNRTPDAGQRDRQTKKIQENVTNVEKHFGQMCQMFAAYVRKTAWLRDKADILVREIGQYADTETPNLKKGLKQFTEYLAKIEDYRQAEVERLEVKVVEPLKSYGSVVKRQREDLKTTQNARDTENKHLLQLEKTRERNPSNRQIISQAENELQKATLEATRTNRQLEEAIHYFEKQKIRDIKKILSDFVTVEMSFHAKAVELYTLAFQSIQTVDEEEDLEVFRSSLHFDGPSRLDIVRANSKSSLNRTGSFRSAPGTLQQQRNGSRQARRMEEEEEEEDTEEDQDESEEENGTDEDTDDGN